MVLRREDNLGEVDARLEAVARNSSGALLGQLPTDVVLGRS
jgi:hypothetical protein